MFALEAHDLTSFTFALAHLCPRTNAFLLVSPQMGELYVCIYHALCPSDETGHQYSPHSYILSTDYRV